MTVSRSISAMVSSSSARIYYHTCDAKVTSPCPILRMAQDVIVCIPGLRGGAGASDQTVDRIAWHWSHLSPFRTMKLRHHRPPTRAVQRCQVARQFVRAKPKSPSEGRSARTICVHLRSSAAQFSWLHHRSPRCPPGADCPTAAEPGSKVFQPQMNADERKWAGNRAGTERGTRFAGAVAGPDAPPGGSVNGER